MNVKNIDDFLHDIDQEKIKDWRIEPDCHEKVKKLVLDVETVLMEEEYERTIQLTKERTQTHGRLGHRPARRWEGISKYEISEELVKEISKSKELDAPIWYDKHYYLQDGSRTYH